ncbi:MAG: hypothetical protein JNJ41_19510 [Bacteroidia bacterium]|nr:hypothetical protein [Bacteroidia bacterium]
MKKVSVALFIVVVLCSFNFLTDPCSSIVFFKEGTMTVMTSYNDDGKVTGTTKTTYSKLLKAASGSTVTANQENYDKKGKLSTKSEFSIKCVKGILYFDMKMMMPQQQAEAYKDFEVTVEGADKEIPSEFVVGSNLKDADIKFTFKTKDGAEMPMMKMNIKVTNRKIEAKENITCAAGTYECYKISEDVEVKSMFTIKAKSINWFSKEVGNVKTESYKENGKFVSKSELTEIK